MMKINLKRIFFLQNLNQPKPQPRSKMSPPTPPSATAPPPGTFDLPNLPNVPSDLPDVPNSDGNNDDDIDFDDLSRRFEELKKKK